MGLQSQATTLHPSGVSQAILLKLLQRWGYDGFEEHVQQVSDFYRKQRDALLAAADRHLAGKATWNKNITAGMCLWIRLNNVDDTKELITKRAVEQKVLFVPGDAFLPADVDHHLLTTPETPLSKTPYLRATFSMATPEEMDEALRR